MNNKDLIFKIIFSSIFLILAIFVIFFDWFKSRIDGVVITLFLIAFLPWLAKYVKSLEAFGIKTELITPEKKNEIEKNSLSISTNDKEVINNNFKIDKSKPIGSEENPIMIDSINPIYDSNDIIEKLVLLRYEIEKNLKILCKKNNITISNKSLSIKSIVELLRKDNILNNNVCNLILDLLPILNKAVHSDITNVDEGVLDWVVEKGIKLLMHLDIIIQNPDAYWMVSFDD